MTTGTRQFPSGAVRSTDADNERYDLVSPVAMRRLAEVCAEGATKYGDFNWEKGLPVADLLNHGLRHLFLYLGGNRDEDHLGHSLWNVAAAVHSEECWPELNAGTLRRPGRKPPMAEDKVVVPEFYTTGVVIPDDDDRGEEGHERYSQWDRFRCPYCGTQSVRIVGMELFGGREVLTLPKISDFEEDGAEHSIDLRIYKPDDPENGACVTLDFRCGNGHDISFRYLTDTDRIDVLS